MEMLIKLYADKPSRIGIKYQYGYLAVRSYEDLVRKYGGETFKINVELMKNKPTLTLVLQSDHTGVKVIYKELGYKPELLKKLNALMKSDILIEFVHIYTEGNTAFIAKPFKQHTFFPITGISIIAPENFTDVM